MTVRVSLFLSDYATEYYAWRPLVGVRRSRQPSKPGPEKPTALLGFTGFFQFFNVLFHDGPRRPEIEATARQTFPGRQGSWPPPPDFWETFT
jgi:hypothetical protein